MHDYGVTPFTKLPPPGTRVMLRTDAGFDAAGSVLAIRPHTRAMWTEIDVVMDQYALNDLNTQRTFYWPAFVAALR